MKSVAPWLRPLGITTILIVAVPACAQGTPPLVTDAIDSWLKTKPPVPLEVTFIKDCGPVRYRSRDISPTRARDVIVTHAKRAPLRELMAAGDAGPAPGIEVFLSPNELGSSIVRIRNASQAHGPLGSLAGRADGTILALEPNCEYAPAEHCDLRFAHLQLQNVKQLKGGTIDERFDLSAAEQRLAWGLDYTKANRHWPKKPGSMRPLVAVMDTGIYCRHPELCTALMSSEQCARQRQSHEAVCPAEAGVDFFDADVDASNCNERGEECSTHGTHVAGIIASVAGNGEGTAGVAPGTQLLSVRIGNGRYNQFACDAALSFGLLYAVERGAHVINISYAWKQERQWMSTALQYAAEHGRDGAGTVVVTGSGNADANGFDLKATSRFPALYMGTLPNVLTTTAVSMGRRDILTSAAYWSDQVLLASPGTLIYSTTGNVLLGPRYFSMSGTSMAAAYASGAVALMLQNGWSAEPAKRIRDHILQAGLKETWPKPDGLAGTFSTTQLDLDAILAK